VITVPRKLIATLTMVTVVTHVFGVVLTFSMWTCRHLLTFASFILTDNEHRVGKSQIQRFNVPNLEGT
jgi:hypothetical protein